MPPSLGSKRVFSNYRGRRRPGQIAGVLGGPPGPPSPSADTVPAAPVRPASTGVACTGAANSRMILAWAAGPPPRVVPSEGGAVGGLGFHRASRQRGSRVVRLGVAALVTMAGAVGALALSGAPPAGAFGLDYFAYPQGGATSPLSCPQTTTVSDQCTLTQALSVAGVGDEVDLAVAGVEGDLSTHYVGNFDAVTPDLTIAPPPGSPIRSSTATAAARPGARRPRAAVPS